MFSYNKNSKEGKLFVTLPPQIRYNFTFLNSITDLMRKVKLSQCNQLYLKIDILKDSESKIQQFYNIMDDKS